MSHRLSALVRPALAAIMLVTMLLVSIGASAAQNDRGLIDDSSYQSPQFGYSVTWAEPWSTNDRDVITNPGGFDTITLRGDGGTVRISGREDSYDPLTFLQDTIAIQLASGGDLINQDTTGAVPTAELLFGNDKMQIDVLSLPDAGAIVLVSLRADQADYDAAVASAGENIQLEGSALFDASAGQMDSPGAPSVGESDADDPEGQDPSTPADGLESPAATPPADLPDLQVATPPAEPDEPQAVMGSGIDGNTYTSPNFGFSVSWDPAIWSAAADDEFSEPGYDTITIDSAAGPIWLSGVEAYNGSASTCLLGEVTYYNDPEFGITDWQVAVDAEGNELTGETETSAWGVYTNTYTDPENPNEDPLPYVDYIECHSLGDGESVVVFYSFSERDAYNEHIGNVLAVVESLELADVMTPAATPEPVVQPSPTAESEPTPEALSIDNELVTVGRTEVTWTGEWEFDTASSTDDQATFSLLDPATGTLKFASYGEFSDALAVDGNEVLEVFAEAYFESAGAEGVEETGAGVLDDGTIWKRYTFDLQGLDVTFLISASVSGGDTYVVTTLTTNTSAFDASLEQVQQEIMLDGEPDFLAGIDADMPSESPTPSVLPATPEVVPGGLTDGAAITGQSHAYSFTPPPGWQVNESSLGGDVEVTSLTNGISTVTVEARAMSPIDLSQCVSNSADEDETEPVYADLVLSSTATGDAFAGADDFIAFANFTFTGPDGESWAHFVECRWIVEGESVLIVTQDVPRELFGSERGVRRLIQNSIEVGP